MEINVSGDRSEEINQSVAQSDAVTTCIPDITQQLVELLHRICKKNRVNRIMINHQWT